MYCYQQTDHGSIDTNIDTKERKKERKRTEWLFRKKVNEGTFTVIHEGETVKLEGDLKQHTLKQLVRKRFLTQINMSIHIQLTSK